MFNDIYLGALSGIPLHRQKQILDVRIDSSSLLTPKMVFVQVPRG